MRHLLILAAAAFLAVGCAGRSEDETGAAPDRGDPAVTATDTTTSVPTDSALGQRPAPTDTSFVQQDTTSMGMPSDTTTGATPGDSALVDHDAPATDTTSMDAPTDSTSMGVPADTSSMTPSDSTAQPNQ